MIVSPRALCGRVSMKQNNIQVCLWTLLILLFSTACNKTHSPTLSTLYTDYLARQDIKREQPEAALSKYYALLENDGNRAMTHSNIGILLDNIQKPDEAEKSLSYALKLAEGDLDKEAVFAIRYNLGVHFGTLKKIPEALDFYQQALELVPNSKEIKTNIELLIQQQQKDQQKKDQKDQKSGDDKNQDKNQNQDQNKQKDNKDKDGNENKNQEQEKQSSPKYQPRPFKGDQLSEGDVKKILGELRNQEQKIRANFDKKEKGRSKKNEKDW